MKRRFFILTAVSVLVGAGFVRADLPCPIRLDPVDSLDPVESPESPIAAPPCVEAAAAAESCDRGRAAHADGPAHADDSDLLARGLDGISPRVPLSAPSRDVPRADARDLPAGPGSLSLVLIAFGGMGT